MKDKKHVHILAICGYTTTGLALIAKDLGYRVTGSDEGAYPPNTDRLDQAGISWINCHDPSNLTKWGRINLIVQGNQIRAGNPELVSAKKLNLPITSDSEFFYELTRNRRRIVVCGSHGKTTISALIAWILEQAGRNPGFRLGTTAKNFRRSVRLGRGEEFVFEGDEYTTTCSDRRPKFYHFHPDVAVINNIEWDHPDIFKTPASYLRLFKNYLVSETTQKGILVCNSEDENVLRIIKSARCRVVTFGLNSGDFYTSNIRFNREKTSFDVYRKGEFFTSISTFLPGIHNIKNSLSAVAVCSLLGVGRDALVKAFLTFKGSSRRFEMVGEVGGVTVVDDYAHHPTKVRETIAAAKTRFTGSRIIVVFVPHTYTRTKALLKEYSEAFQEADLVIIPDIEPARERNLSALINSEELISKISSFQKNAFYIPESGEVINFIKKEVRPGDVILCMSVGGFRGFAGKLFSTLKNNG